MRQPPTFAVRRDWPGGDHDYFRLCTTLGDAQAGIEPDRAYWRRNHFRPKARRVVEISANDFELHRHRIRCQSPDCP